MRQFCLILLAMLPGLLAQSQSPTPGFLGKRWMVGMQYHGGLGLGVFTGGTSYRRGYNGPTLDDPPFLISTLGLSADYILTRRAVIGLGLRYAWLGMNPEFGAPGFYRLHSLGFGFQFEWYPFVRRGTIAPVGTYTRLRAHVHHSWVFATLPSPDESPPETGPRLGNSLGASLGIEFGNNFLVTDFLSLGPGVGLSYVLPVSSNPDGLDDNVLRNIRDAQQLAWSINLYLEARFLF